MGQQINQYPKIRTAITVTDDDLFDLDSTEDLGVSHVSASIKASELATYFSSVMPTIYTGNGTLTGVRTVDLNSSSLTFFNGLTQLVGGGATSATNALEVHDSTGLSDGIIFRNDSVLLLTGTQIISRQPGQLGNLLGVAGSVEDTLSGISVNTNSTINHRAIEAISATTGAGVETVGVFGSAIAANGANLFGLQGQARNGTGISYGVYGQILTGGSVVSGSGTVAVNGFNNNSTATTNNYGVRGFAISTAGTNAYGIAGFSTGVGGTNNIGGRFEATGATNNYAIIVPTAQGNIGFGTITPNVNALLDLSSTTQGMLLMRMTAVQASAITPVDGMMLYVTSTDATFTTVGFWGRTAGVWGTLN